MSGDLVNPTFDDLIDLIGATVDESAGYLSISDIDNMLDLMYEEARANPDMLIVSTRDHFRICRLVAKGRRYHRAWLRKKRQRRVAQRRHYRGK